MGRVLLIDDSIDIGALVKQGLGHLTVDHVQSLKAANEALQSNDYGLLLIDVSLPDGNGFDLCVQLSQDPRLCKVPRILLTAMDQPSEKVFGFTCGADDYVTKPFHIIELRARIDRYLQKQGSAAEQRLSCFVFNSDFQTCHMVEGEQKTNLQLTPTEFRLLFMLVKNEGRVLSRKELEEAGWESRGATIEARGIDTHIAHLRRKLGAARSMLLSVYGQGYSFKDNSSDRKAA